jgi:transposase
VLLGISKRGDTYLRSLLVHGARAVVRYVKNKNGRTEDWLHGLLSRRNTNVAVVALANKMCVLCGLCWPMAGSLRLAIVVQK